MSPSHNTEYQFHGLNAGEFHESTPQMHPQGCPPGYPWVQGSHSPYHNMGTLEHRQPMEAHYEASIESRSPGTQFNHMQQSPYYGLDSQYAHVYGFPDDVDSSAAENRGMGYLPPPDSPGSGSDGTTN